MRARELTAKQQAFVAEYCVDFNGARAAKAAGFSAKSAARHAVWLLNKSHVRVAVEAKKLARSKKLDITAERVLQEWARIAFAKGNDAVSFSEGGVTLKDSDDLDDDVLATISEVSQTTSDSGGSVRIKFHSKPDALQALTKHLGLEAPLKVEHSGAVEVTAQTALEQKLNGLQKRLRSEPAEPGGAPSPQSH